MTKIKQMRKWQCKCGMLKMHFKQTQGKHICPYCFTEPIFKIERKAFNGKTSVYYK